MPGQSDMNLQFLHGKCPSISWLHCLLTMRWESEFTGSGPKWLWCSKTVKRDDNVTENRDGGEPVLGRGGAPRLVCTDRAGSRQKPPTQLPRIQMQCQVNQGQCAGGFPWREHRLGFSGWNAQCQIHWFSQIGGRQLLHSVILVHRKMQLAVLASLEGAW